MTSIVTFLLFWSVLAVQGVWRVMSPGDASSTAHGVSIPEVISSSEEIGTLSASTSAMRIYYTII